MRKNKQEIVIEDISGKYAALGLLGPHTEDLFNELLAPPHSTDNVPCGTCRVNNFIVLMGIHFYGHKLLRHLFLGLKLEKYFNLGH